MVPYDFKNKRVKENDYPHLEARNSPGDFVISTIMTNYVYSLYNTSLHETQQ